MSFKPGKLILFREELKDPERELKSAVLKYIKEKQGDGLIIDSSYISTEEMKDELLAEEEYGNKSDTKVSLIHNDFIFSRTENIDSEDHHSDDTRDQAFFQMPLSQTSRKYILQDHDQPTDANIYLNYQNGFQSDFFQKLERDWESKQQTELFYRSRSDQNAIELSDNNKNLQTEIQFELNQDDLWKDFHLSAPLQSRQTVHEENIVDKLEIPIRDNSDTEYESLELFPQSQSRRKQFPRSNRRGEDNHAQPTLTNTPNRDYIYTGWKPIDTHNIKRHFPRLTSPVITRKYTRLPIITSQSTRRIYEEYPQIELMDDTKRFKTEPARIQKQTGLFHQNALTSASRLLEALLPASALAYLFVSSMNKKRRRRSIDTNQWEATEEQRLQLEILLDRFVNMYENND